MWVSARKRIVSAQQEVELDKNKMLYCYRYQVG